MNGKRNLNFGLVIIVIIFCQSFMWYTLPVDQTVSLEKAVEENSVSIKINSAGGYSGSCINLEILNNSSSSRQILIPAGTVFNPDDESMQDIYVVQEQLISLNGKQKKEIRVAGFCCQADDRSPKSGTGFSLSKTKNNNLLALSEFLKDKRFDEDILQTAVWCVSDGHDLSDLWDDGENSVGVKSLRTFLSKLTGQKDSWYETKINRTVNDEGYISREPLTVKGMIAFTADKVCTVKELIKSADGSFEYTPKNSMQLPRPGKYEYDFSVTVRGWKKGKYAVHVFAGEKEILVQEFEI